jgi:hypothetical protein
MTWDNVSNEIAEILLDWIEKHVEQKQPMGPSRPLKACT